MKTRCRSTSMRQTNEIRRSWVWDVLGTSCHFTGTVFVKCATESHNIYHNYKNQIILHITIDFHYKAMYQLVSLLFSLHDCMSLNKNDD